VVSKMLGHSSMATTVDTYAHLLAGIGQRSADNADAMIPRKSRDQLVTTRPVPPVRVDESPGELGGPRGTRTHHPRRRIGGITGAH
jgi:hypothetical protein